MTYSATSENYRLFAEALTQRKQILCAYNGYRRELCPIILGHSNGEEMALTFQFGGESSSVLPSGGQWRCLQLADVSDIKLRAGKWYSGTGHSQPQGCVKVVDLDVNPSSPYHPKRHLTPP